MPIGAVTSQAGDLEPQDDPGPAHAHFGHELLEALPVGGRGAREALVAVDYLYLVQLPAHGQSPLAQGILASRGLRVECDLVQGRLAQIEIGSPRQVPGCHLLGRQGSWLWMPGQVERHLGQCRHDGVIPTPSGRSRGWCSGVDSARQVRIQAAIPWRMRTATPPATMAMAAKLASAPSILQPMHKL